MFPNKQHRDSRAICKTPPPACSDFSFQPGFWCLYLFVFHNKHQSDNYEKESRAICKTPSGFSLFPARIHEIVLPRPGAVIREQQGAGRLPQFIFLWFLYWGLYRVGFLTQRSKGQFDNDSDVFNLEISCTSSNTIHKYTHESKVRKGPFKLRRGLQRDPFHRNFLFAQTGQTRSAPWSSQSRLFFLAQCFFICFHFL